MNKLLTKIVGVALGATMAVGVGVAAVKASDGGMQRADAAEEVYYTLTPVSTGGNSAPHNSYTQAATTTIGGIGWSVTGNSNMVPWRIGGKSISNVDRDVHSTTAMGSAISKVELELGAASSITVNSVKLAVGSSESSSNIDTITKDSGDLFNTTLTFTPSSGSEWATSSYYTFTLNVSVSGTSNKFVAFNSAKFYRNASSGSTYTVIYDLNGGTGTSNIPEDDNEYSSGDTVTVLGIGDVQKSGYSFVNWSDGSNTYDEGDTFSITTNTTLTAQWYKNDSISVVSGKETNNIYTGASLVLTSCVTYDGDGALSFDVDTSMSYIKSYNSETYTLVADSLNTGGPTTITAHKGSETATFTVTVLSRPSTGTFELFSGAIEEGEYIVVSGTTALKAELASNTNYIGYDSVTITNDTITDPTADLIWTVEASGDYYTLYNALNDNYAASTGAKNKGQVIAAPVASGDLDKTLWTVSGTSTYEFVNKQNTASSVNANLRYNSGYGFACYSTSTGSALSLYKLPESPKTIVDSEMTVGTVSASTGDTEWTLSGFGFSVLYDGDSDFTDVTSQTTFTVTEAVPSITASGTMDVHVTPTYKGVDYDSEQVTATLNALLQSHLIPGTNGYSDASEQTAMVWTDSTQTGTVYLSTITYEPQGGGNAGKYYANGSNWRFYRTGPDTLTISARTGFVITEVIFTFNVSDNGILVDPNDSSEHISSGTAWNPTTPDRSFVFAVSASSGNSGQVRFTDIVVKYAESTDPTVVINALTSEVTKGDTGTFTAETAHATSPSLTWTSADSGIIRIDNSSTGAFTAVGFGEVIISVSMSCTEGSANDTLVVSVNAGLITISQAKAICQGLASGETTNFKVTISGYITNFNPDSQDAGKERALTVADYKFGGSGDDIMVFGVRQVELREYAVLNGSVSYTGYLQNSSGTFEMTSPTLESYTDDAIEFAKFAYEYFDEVCSTTGLNGITQEDWDDIAQYFTDNVDSYSKQKLQDATTPYQYNEDINNWLNRYSIIVGCGFSDFMGRTDASNSINPINKVNNTVAIVVVVTISLVSVSALGAYFLLRKKKEER